MARTLDFLARVFASRSCCFAKRVCRYTRRLILCLCCARNSHRCLGCLHFCLFGKERFRPMQRELVECALEGRSCIGILPTGSGKSLCYQIPAVLGNGLTVVVSPLIALMRDQVAGLERLGVAAARYDSTLAEEDKAALMDRLTSGSVRLLFAAPESLESPWIQQAMELVPPGLFVVDEAHCLSEWGHSFRPDYLGLPGFFKKHGFRCVMALTATATERVCRDLAGLFGVR